MQNELDRLFESTRRQHEKLARQLLGLEEPADPNEDPSMGLHSADHPHCDDPECGCNTVLLAPGEREFLDVLNIVTNDDNEIMQAIEEGYMAFYDETSTPEQEFTTSALYEFATTTPDTSKSEKWNRAFAIGWFMAFGEHDPRYRFKSADPPARD